MPKIPILFGHQYNLCLGSVTHRVNDLSPLSSPTSPDSISSSLPMAPSGPLPLY
ncbi:hypothetical protein J6590_081622, partial [Homalodisca vitripennis]